MTFGGSIFFHLVERSLHSLTRDQSEEDRRGCRPAIMKINMQTATRVFLFAIVVALAIVLARFSIVIDG